MKVILLMLFTCCLLFSCRKQTLPQCDLSNQNIEYPIIAHSHNDYEQAEPVIAALQHGFTSLEVDIVYDGLDIRVSHDKDDLSEKPIFESNYLKTIVHSSMLKRGGLILLVDIKEYSEALLTKLNSILSKYGNILVDRERPLLMSNKVKVILSGDIPRSKIINDPNNKYLFIDGRLTENDLESSNKIVPMISINIQDIPLLDDKYYNKGTKDETILKTIELVHAKDKMIRFWNTKNSESTWISLIKLNVDIIGVDDIEYFCRVMKKHDLIK